jgi:pimeloyl-[acyl-carrier protein] methyl ester esterase
LPPERELVLLHALPLDAAMWEAQREILPGATCAPTLYGLGDRVEDWAAAVLKRVTGGRLILVGCSVGGSCALEIAAAAPERVEALVLIGTKASHRPDPALHAAAIETVRERGLESAWNEFWAPSFSRSAGEGVVDHAKRIALRQSPVDVARGVTAFHTRPSRDRVLSDYAGPVVVVTGAEDTAPGPKVSAAQAAQAPKGRLVVVPDCGHYVPLERPERLSAILNDVISSLP